MILGLGLGLNRLAAGDAEPVAPPVESTNAPPPPPPAVPAGPQPALPPAATEPSTHAAQTARTLEHAAPLFQEQLRAFLLALETSRIQSDAAAEAQAAAVSKRLLTLEETLRDQRHADLDVIRDAHRTMLIVAGMFAALVLAVVMITAWSQARAMNRLKTPNPVPPAPSPPSLTVPHPTGSDPLPAALLPSAESSQRLLAALDRIERRIGELEQFAVASPPPPAAAPAPGASPASLALPTAPGGAPVGPSAGGNAGKGDPDARQADEVSLLLGQGQSLLASGHAQRALACFEEVIAREPRHAEALLKKGMALEQQANYKEALEYYDRALEANRSLTLAYLHKGGVFNQLERFDEALQCYEQALRLRQHAAPPAPA